MFCHQRLFWGPWWRLCHPSLRDAGLALCRRGTRAWLLKVGVPQAWRWQRELYRVLRMWNEGRVGVLWEQHLVCLRHKMHEDREVLSVVQVDLPRWTTEEEREIAGAWAEPVPIGHLKVAFVSFMISRELNVGFWSSPEQVSVSQQREIGN